MICLRKNITQELDKTSSIFSLNIVNTVLNGAASSNKVVACDYTAKKNIKYQNMVLQIQSFISRNIEHEIEKKQKKKNFASIIPIGRNTFFLSQKIEYISITNTLIPYKSI